MLNRGFSLLEMLFALALTSLVVMSAITFYPQFQLNIIYIHQQNRLEEAVNQALSSLVKDIKRSGFIANNPRSPLAFAIELNAAGNCIILRYDLDSTGRWKHNIHDPQTSDIFAYRYYKKNLEYQTGITHCKGSSWEKMFDQNEVNVTHFKLIQHNHYVEIQLSAALKKNTSIQYQTIRYVKNENR